MRDHSIFGETLCGQPALEPSAGTRTQTGPLWHGLFGTKLFPEPDEAPRPRIGPDKLRQSLS